MKRKHIQGCNCCEQCYDIFTVVVTDSCTGAPIPLATVTAALPGQISITATTNSSGYAEVRTHTAGTWTFTVSADTYTSVTQTAIADCSGTYKQVDVVMSKSGGTTTLSVSTVNNCTSAAISGATVTATQGATTITGTTSSSGSVALTLPKGGAWTVTASRTGFGTQTRTITVTCWTTTLGSFALAATTDTTKLTITARGCGGGAALPGTAVTISRGGFTFSDTTNASGQVVWNHIPVGSWTAVLNRTGFVTGSLSGNVVLCNQAATAALTLTPAPGYRCFNGPGCADVAPETIYLLDPVVGMVPLTWKPDVTTDPEWSWLGLSGSGLWSGTASIPGVAKDGSCSPAALDWPLYFAVFEGGARFYMYGWVCRKTSTDPIGPFRGPATGSPAPNLQDRDGWYSPSSGLRPLANPVGCLPTSLVTYSIPSGTSFAYVLGSYYGPSPTWTLST